MAKVVTVETGAICLVGCAALIAALRHIGSDAFKRRIKIPNYLGSAGLLGFNVAGSILKSRFNWLQ